MAGGSKTVHWVAACGRRVTEALTITHLNAPNNLSAQHAHGKEREARPCRTLDPGGANPLDGMAVWVPTCVLEVAG